MKTLTDLLALGEGFTIEFKRSLRSDLGREICAFANAAGGAILLGVEDDGTVRGVQGHNRLKSRVQSIARSTEPPIGVDVESMGEVLCVRVPAQRGKPYSFGGRFFIREGASSQQMSRDEVRDFFFAEGVIRFDESPCNRFSLDGDLDEDTWAAFRRRAKIPDHMEPETALGNLRLLAGDGRITNAGAWLLAKDIRRVHSSAHLTCALFQGTTKTEILDRRDFPGDVYSMIDGAMTWVRSKINVCREWEVPAPAIDVSERWVTVTFRRVAWGGEGSEATSKRPGRHQVGTKLAPSRHQVGTKSESSVSRWRRSQ